jgi:hypothetical protein
MQGGHEGRPYYGRDWVYGSMIREKQAGDGASSARFPRPMDKIDQVSSIVGVPLVRTLPATRPARSYGNAYGAPLLRSSHPRDEGQLRLYTRADQRPALAREQTHREFARACLANPRCRDGPRGQPGPSELSEQTTAVLCSVRTGLPPRLRFSHHLRLRTATAG